MSETEATVSVETQETPKTVPNTIPYSRFAEVVQDRNVLVEKLADVERQLSQLQEKAATVDLLNKQLQEAQQRYERYRAIASQGITDPELVAAVEWVYSRLPEKDRPTLEDALQLWRSDPEKAPVVLRPHIAPPSTPVQTPVSVPVQVNANVQTQRGPAPNAYTMEGISGMSPEEYKAHRQAIFSSLGIRSR